MRAAAAYKLYKWKCKCIVRSFHLHLTRFPDEYIKLWESATHDELQENIKNLSNYCSFVSHCYLGFIVSHWVSLTSSPHKSYLELLELNGLLTVLAAWTLHFPLDWPFRLFELICNENNISFHFVSDHQWQIRWRFLYLRKTIGFRQRYVQNVDHT